jgi:hypothetical protein
LARYIGERLREELKKTYGFVADVLRIEVEENVGQSATWELRK